MIPSRRRAGRSLLPLVALLVVTGCDPSLHETDDGWVRQVGGRGLVQVESAVAMPDGVAVAGQFSDRVDLGEGVVRGDGRSSAFVARYDQDGGVLWTRPLPHEGFQSASALAAAPNDDLVLLGYSDQSLDGDLSAEGRGDFDVLVARFDGATGEVRWAALHGGPESDGSDNPAVAVSPSDETVVASAFSGTADFGGEPLEAVAMTDALVVSYDGDGANRWQRRFGELNLNYTEAVVALPDGDIVAAGTFEGTVDFGGGDLPAEGAFSAWLARFTGDGEHVWSRTLPTGLVAGLAADEEGHLYMAGTFSGTVDLGGGAMTADAAFDVFVASFDGDGGHRWSRRLGDGGEGRTIHAIQIDPDGLVLLAGYFRDEVVIDGASHPGSGGRDGLVVTLDAEDGSGALAHTFGGPEEWDVARGIAPGPGADLYVVGDFEGAVEFGGQTLRARGGDDGFVWRMGP